MDAYSHHSPTSAPKAFAFDNSFARDMKGFYSRTDPAPVSAPRLLRLNHSLAAELGVDAAALERPDGVAILAGNSIAEGAEPIALAYAGHQFGGFSPQLGDGRALLIGEVVGRDGARRDIQLKGSGRTPFSRGGDGRAALGPVLREYLISDAMHALGIPTTRALAAVSSGDAVRRETMLPGAVLTRVAASHVRIGTFQFFAARGETEKVKRLADHVIARHYPELAGAAEPYLRLFEAVMERQASLVARWMLVGFIHGVMNTDNMAVSGETIDYGPCAFMNAYNPATVFSSIDRHGRYAYGNQPRIAQWNLARFGETLLGLIDADADRAVSRATSALETFPERYARHWLAGMRRKLGLASDEDNDDALAGELLSIMATGGADFTNTFRALAPAADGDEGPARSQFADPTAFDAWAQRWQARLGREPDAAGTRIALMNAANPAYIPRNHLVEEALAAAHAGDMAPFDRLHAVLLHPYEERRGLERYTEPQWDDGSYQTFCGT